MSKSVDIFYREEIHLVWNLGALLFWTTTKNDATTTINQGPDSSRLYPGVYEFLSYVSTHDIGVTFTIIWGF
jgi:hypothetical protein